MEKMQFQYPTLNGEEQSKPPASSPSQSLPFNFLLAIAKRQGFPERHITACGTPLGAAAPWHAALQRIAHAAPGEIMVILGPRGTGKTQLATAVALPYLAERQFDERRLPRYAKLSDIFREVRGTFRTDSPDAETAVFEKYVRPGLLVIDEAHERAESDFENRTLTQIVDKRYDALRTTLLIANQTREELARSVGASIVSRFEEGGACIVCDWPSFRVKP